jgi:hypothetical protein
MMVGCDHGRRNSELGNCLDSRLIVNDDDFRADGIHQESEWRDLAAGQIERFGVVAGFGIDVGFEHPNVARALNECFNIGSSRANRGAELLPFLSG